MSKRSRIAAAASRGGVLLFVVVAGIASIAGTLHSFFGEAGEEGKWGMTILAAFTAAFFSLAVLAEYRYARKARYADAAPSLRRVYQYCIDAAANPPQTENEIRALGQAICDKLANAFGRVSGTRCACCIKVLLDDGEVEPRPYLSALARDDQSSSRNTEGVKHWLDANTAFSYVFRSKGRSIRRAFIENDLPTRSNYSNTSHQIYKSEPRRVPNVPLIRNYILRWQWKLPYRSTIVAAILPSEDAESEELLGFLCVDSASRGAFSPRYDADWVTATAVALYPLLRTWFTVTSPKNVGTSFARFS